jgi:hypothetical protein
MQFIRNKLRSFLGVDELSVRVEQLEIKGKRKAKTPTVEPTSIKVGLSAAEAASNLQSARAALMNAGEPKVKPSDDEL